MIQGPRRIICLTEETTEWLYLLGEQERIVGISAYTVRPAVAKEEKPVVSAFISGSVPKIAELKPDLIIGFSDIQAELAKKLIEAGLNVLIFNQRSIDEIFEMLAIVSNLVHQTARAEKLISDWRRKIDTFQNKKPIYRPRVFFQEWDDPIICGIRWVSEAIEIVGGEDCFKDRREGFLAKNRIVSAQEVAAKNPEIIFGSWCGKPVDFDWIRRKSEWQGVEAVRHNWIVAVDPSIILQPGPALFVDGLDALKRGVANGPGRT